MSKILHLVLLLAGFICAIQSQFAMPGAISSTVSIQSVNNIASSFLPKAVAYALNDQTLNFSLTDKGVGYTVEIHDIHIVSIDGWETKAVEFIPGTDKVRFLFKGINIKTIVNGTINALWLINLDAATCDITDLTIQFDLAINQNNDLKWTLDSSIIISVEDVDFKTTSSWFNECLSIMHSIIVKTVNSDLSKFEDKIEAALDQFVLNLNTNATYYMLNLFNNTEDLFNISTTISPSLYNDTQLFSIHFDGLFYDMKSKTSVVTPNEVFPPRYLRSHSEQIWVHQSTLNSLYQTYGKSLMPMVVQNDDLTMMLLTYMPEINTFYGQNIQMSLAVSLQEPSQNLIELSKQNGMKIGDKERTVFALRAYVTNETTKYDFAFEFKMFVEFDVNISLQDYIGHVKIYSHSVDKANITHNACRLNPNRKYSQLFNQLAGMIIDQANSDLQKGIDLSTLNKKTEMISKMFTNTTASIQQENEFIYIGFNYVEDHFKQYSEDMFYSFLQF